MTPVSIDITAFMSPDMPAAGSACPTLLLILMVTRVSTTACRIPRWFATYRSDDQGLIGRSRLREHRCRTPNFSWVASLQPDTDVNSFDQSLWGSDCPRT